MKPKYRLIAAAAITISLAGHVAASEKYTYDASGNIIEKSIGGNVTKMSFDTSNRVISKQTNEAGAEMISYDAAGHPVAERNMNGQAIRSVSYGYGDKVLEMQNQGVKSGFYYNAEGQLVASKSDGAVSTYAWDGNDLAAKEAQAYTNEASGALLIEGDSKVVVSDYLGNTLMMGDRTFNSSAYGEGLENGRFTGKPWIEELGSFVFPHRSYSPQTSSWSVADPSGFPDGPNRYAYVNGDPLSRVDPLGLKYEIKVSDDPEPHLSDSASPTSALTVAGTITNNVSAGDHPTSISVDYKTTGSGSGLFTSYSGTITGTAKIYCNATSGAITAYQYSGSWQQTGGSGAIATKVTSQAETGNDKVLTTSSNHSGTTAGGATVTGAGFTGPGGVGGSLSWSAGATAIDCTTSCVYKSLEY